MKDLPDDVRADVEYLKLAFTVLGFLVRWESQRGKGSPCPTDTLAMNIAAAETPGAGPPPTAEDLKNIVEILFKKMEAEGLVAFQGVHREAIALRDQGRQHWMNAREQYEDQRKAGLRTGPPAFDPQRRGGCAAVVCFLTISTTIVLLLTV